MARDVFQMKVTSSVRVKGPIITEKVSAAVAVVVEESVKARIHEARNLTDSAAKPLTAQYAKWKSKWAKYRASSRYLRVWTKTYRRYLGLDGKTRKLARSGAIPGYKSLWTKPIPNPRLGAGTGRPVRDLFLTGEMLGNLTIRKATPEQITLALTERGARMKAHHNAQVEEWLGYSRRNERDVMTEASRQIAIRAGELTQEHTPSD